MFLFFCCCFKIKPLLPVASSKSTTLSPAQMPLKLNFEWLKPVKIDKRGKGSRNKPKNSNLPNITAFKIFQQNLQP